MIQSNSTGKVGGFWLLVLLFLSLLELRKALLVLWKNQFHLFLAAQTGLLLLYLYPGDKQRKHDEIINDYKRKIKIYAVLTMIGSLFFIFIVLVAFSH